MTPDPRTEGRPAALEPGAMTLGELASKVMSSASDISAAATGGSYSFVRHLGLAKDQESFGAVVELMKKGLPFKAVRKFQEAATLTPGELSAAVQIPERTLHRRKEEGRLAADESDRLLRSARVFDLALQLFEGDATTAMRWLRSPQPGLGGEVPWSIASTDVGAREIEHLIGRLEHGVIA